MGTSEVKPHWIDPMMPKMKCDKGCGSCCGVAACSLSEFDRVMAYAKSHGVTPLRQGVTCPFYQDGGCAVYEARPTVCRFFGHTEHMVCEKGYNVNVSAKAEKYIASRMRAEAGPVGSFRLLHEAAYSMEEAGEVVREECFKATPILVNGRLIREPSAKGYSGARILEQVGKPLFAECIDTKHFDLMSGSNP